MQLIDPEKFELCTTVQAPQETLSPPSDGWLFYGLCPRTGPGRELAILWVKARERTATEIQQSWLHELGAALGPLLAAEAKPGGPGPAASRETLSRLRDAMDRDSGLADLLEQYRAEG